MSLSICVATGRMSISSKVQPRRVARSIALRLVPAVVAKPGMVMAIMSLRGRPRRSMARAATINACVESRPPETPITSLGLPIARRRCSSPATWIE